MYAFCIYATFDFNGGKWKCAGGMMRETKKTTPYVCVFMQLFCEKTRMVGNGKYKIYAMF